MQVKSTLYCSSAISVTSLPGSAKPQTGILSLGEQLRLAIGRALLGRPQVVFLDEANSAMDEGLELTMYRVLRKALPSSILVNVGYLGRLELR